MKSDCRQYKGLPYVGGPLLVAANDPEGELPVLRHKVVAAMIDVAEPRQRLWYETFLQKCIEGAAQLFEKRHCDATGKIYVEGAWLYYAAPGESSQYTPEIDKEIRTDA